MSKKKPQPDGEAQPFKLLELDRPRPAPAPAERHIPTHANLSDFQALFVGTKVVDPRKQAVDQARAITEQAKAVSEQAKAELEQAKAQVEGIKKKGYEEGYEQGLKEGKEASAGLIMASCDNLGRAVEALERAKTQVLAGMEDEIIALVQAVVDRIFLIPGAVHPELVRQVARASVHKLSESDTLTLALNPSDLNTVEEFAPQIKQGLGQLKLLNLIADESLHPGDCRVTTAEAQVEASLETRRQRIFGVLEDLAQRSEGLDLDAVLAKIPPAVEALRQEARQGKTKVTPDDFGAVPSDVSDGLDGLEDLEELSGLESGSGELEDW